MSEPRTRSSATRRIAIVAPDRASLRRNRGDLITAMIGARHQVLCLAPEQSLADDTRAQAWAASCGVTLAGYPRASSIGLFSSRKPAASIAESLIEYQPHMVLAYGPLALSLGLEAAKKAKVPRKVGLITRLGSALGDDAAKPSWSAGRNLRLALAAAEGLVFHNHNDYRRLKALGLITGNAQVEVVAGAGVDLLRFQATPLPTIEDGITVTMIASKDQRTGVLLFCQAARKVRERSKSVRFILAGPNAAGPGAVSPAMLQGFADVVEIQGDLDDVRPLLASSHIVVLPSLGEGMPRVLLEAMSVGRPLITTDIPGCRETVDERVNGVLVAPNDVGALAAAIENVLRRPDLIPSMARASRAKAERCFDVRDVNKRWFSVLGLD